MPSDLKLKKNEFVKYLDALSKVSDLASLQIKTDKIISLLANSENTLYVIGEMNHDNDLEVEMNCPSLSKLKKLISLIPSDDDVDLSLDENNLSYKSKGVKFKYHLYDDGIISKPKLTLEKVKNFEYDIEFDISKDFISKILKLTPNVVTNKIYFTTDDESRLFVEIKDDTKPNSDSLSVLLSDNVDFSLNFVFKIDNLQAITFSDFTTFRFNTKLGLCSMISSSNGYKIEYITPSLTK